jgi:hypothetical protein
MERKTLLNFVLIYLSSLVVFCSCFTDKNPELIAYISKGFELYAPTQVDLESTIPKIEYAAKQMKKLLGEEPPKVAFLLFSSNKDLVSYDYSEFIKRETSCFPWLTKAAMIDLKKSVENKLDPAKSFIIARTIPSLGVSLRYTTLHGDTIFEVTGVETADFREAWDLPPVPNGFRLEKRDIIKKMNGIAYNHLFDFEDAFYSIPDSSKITLEVIRDGSDETVNFSKPKTEKPVPQKSQEDEETNYSINYFDEFGITVSHEAGHIFFSTYVQLMYNKFYPENGEYFNLIDFVGDTLTYGHPNIPDWLDEAVAIFCEPAVARQDRILGMKQNLEERIALKEFLVMIHPTTAAELKNPKLRPDYASEGVVMSVGKTAQEYGLFYEHAIAFTQYLIEVEGSRFIGEIIRGYIAGQDFETVLKSAKKVPKNIQDLETEWLKWLVDFDVE